jgi:hypothetical protein
MVARAHSRIDFVWGLTISGVANTLAFPTERKGESISRPMSGIMCGSAHVSCAKAYYKCNLQCRQTQHVSCPPLAANDVTPVSAASLDPDFGVDMVCCKLVMADQSRSFIPHSR